MKRMRKTICLVAVIILVFVGIGYISAIVSRVACENDTARSVAEGSMRGRLFYVDSDDRDSVRIFRRIGAPVEEYVKSSSEPFRRVLKDGNTEVPDVDKGGITASVSTARVSLPFVVGVRYFAHFGSLGGVGATRYYLCLFGLTFHVQTDVDMLI